MFSAVRDMDEILVANFMVFADLVEDEPYDLWVADEGWDVDAFLHDNPELKRTAFAWLTDFTGWLPMPDGGPAEAARTADWNAERIDRGLRYPRLRDRSIFVGNEADLVDLPLGPGLPTVREWGRRRYDFAGYVLGSGPAIDREEARAALGYRPDERICLVTVGGSAVGSLLRRPPTRRPPAEKRVPGLRMVLVTGPRIDPASIPSGWRCAATCRTCSSTWRPATSPSCRAGCRRRWSSPPPAAPSSTCRCAATSSSRCTCRTGWPGTPPDGAWTTPTRRTPSGWPRSSPRRSDGP